VVVEHIGGESGTNAMLASLDFQYANKCTPNYVQGYHDQWVNDPWSLGTYSYYRPGAFTNYAGSEWVAQGGVHFCGEHAWDGTAVGYEERGMMSSAYLTGERAASEVRTALGL
jgi:monoamine oxidase